MLGEVVVSKKESVEVNESQRIEAYANAIIPEHLFLKSGTKSRTFFRE